MSTDPKVGFKILRLSSSARAALVCAALAVYWIATLDIQKSWAWDEAMHGELPALRLMFSLGSGDLHAFWTVLHSCQQYPFGWPLVLGGVQTVFGISEFVARSAGIALWGASLWGIFLLAQEIVRGRRQTDAMQRRGDDVVPWMALAFGALSPLALGYAGSLFLEVPVTFCAIFALRAWVRRSTRRDEPGAFWRELAVGFWLSAAFFTKFNYGILLIFGCSLDGLLGLLSAMRAGRLAHEARCLLVAATPLVLALLWWLVLPLPFGLEMGAEHRRVMFEFLSGNQQMAPTPWEQRVIFWTVYLTFTARLFAVQLLSLLCSLRSVFTPGVRLLWVVFLGAGLPVWTHNFHLDRFLIPGAPAFWILAAVGLAPWLPLKAIARAGTLAALGLAVLLVPTADGPWVARQLGVLGRDVATRFYVTNVLKEKPRLGADRCMWTPGIAPKSVDAILKLVKSEVGADESVGWIGINTEIPPAAVHIALVQDTGNKARFLRDAHRRMDVNFTGEDPKWSLDRLREFVARFDVIITTDPPDIGQRSNRAYTRRYAEHLRNELGWTTRRLGEVRIPKETGSVVTLTVYALRPPGDARPAQ